MTGLRRWARRFAVALAVVVLFGGVAWLVRHLGLTSVQMLTVYAVLSLAWFMWLSWDRANLHDRADDALDVADRALHDAHAIAKQAEMARERPERPRERPTGATRAPPHQPRHTERAEANSARYDTPAGR